MAADARGFIMELFCISNEVKKTVMLSQSDCSILSHDGDVTDLISLSQSDASILSHDQSMPQIFYLLQKMEELHCIIN